MPARIRRRPGAEDADREAAAGLAPPVRFDRARGSRRRGEAQPFRLRFRLC